MRLDQAVSKALGVSRKLARQQIYAGRVHLNGEVASDPSQHIDATHNVSYDGAELGQPQARYFMLNKPTGYVCTRGDAHHPSVFDLLPGEAGLQVAGRLDADTLGLVLLTDDGKWNHRLTAPRRQCSKHYRVTLAAPLPDTALELLRAGVHLNDERRPTLPAKVERLNPVTMDLWISEGRYHQVKRMVAAVGGHVVGLTRLAIGPIELDPALLPGAWRSLTAAEVAAFEP